MSEGRNHELYYFYDIGRKALMQGFQKCQNWKE